MISMKQAKKLKPGTILFRLAGKVDDLRILATTPVMRHTVYRVYFEGRNEATGHSHFRGCGVVADEFFLSEKEAFLASIEQMRGAQHAVEGRFKALAALIQLAEQAAKKKGWIDG